MSRVLAVAGPDPGHLYPVVGVASALAGRGHVVVVATGADHLGDLRAEGLAAVELPHLAPRVGDDDWAYRMWDRAAQMAPALVDLLDEVPDVVVSDTLTVAGAFTAELLGVPWVEVVPHYVPDTDPALPPVGLGRRPADHLLRRLDDAWIRRRQDTSVAIGRAHRDRVRASLGLTGTGRPAARLACSLPLLEHPRSRWPADLHLVGSLAWEPPWAELDVPAGTGPLVVVTDSTASTADVGLGAAALAGLRGIGVRLVVTTGADLDPWPQGAVVGRGPHGPLLDHADMAVSPGGGGFVSKALARGVPLVVVPEQGDQREAAARVAHAGVGVALSSGAGPTALRVAVQRVLGDPRYRDAAASAANESSGRGPTMAADVVESVLAGRPLVGHGPRRDHG